MMLLKKSFFCAAGYTAFGSGVSTEILREFVEPF